MTENERLTEATKDCFGYGLKDFTHKKGEFKDYDTFYAYQMAIKRLGEYEDIGTVEDILMGIRKSEEEFDMLMEYRAIGTVEKFKALKEIDEDLRLKYCYENLSSAENRGYMKGCNEAIVEFANFLHKKAKENNGLRLSSDTRSWTQPNIFDYVEEFKNEQICKEED